MEVNPGCVPSSFLSGRGNLPWKAASSGFKSPLEGSLNSLALSFPIAVPVFLFSCLSDWLCLWGPSTLHSVFLDGAARAGHLWWSQLQRPQHRWQLPPAWGEGETQSAGDIKDAGWARSKALVAESPISFLSVSSPYSSSASSNHTQSLCPHTYNKINIMKSGLVSFENILAYIFPLLWLSCLVTRTAQNQQSPLFLSLVVLADEN